MNVPEKIIATYPEVKISHCHDANTNCMVFRFKGHFTEHAARKSVDNWIEYQSKVPDDQLTHVWICSEMTSFENGAKNIWMEHLKEQRPMIKSIQIVSDNIVIRGAARIMSKFSRLPLNVYKKETEIRL